MIKSVIISMLIVYIMNTSPRWNVHGIKCVLLNIVIVVIYAITIELFFENIGTTLKELKGGDEIE